MKGIRIIGLTDGSPTPLDGKWLSRYEPLNYRWEEIASMDELVAALEKWVAATDDPALALGFAAAVDAMECWRQPGHGIRPWDGKPNRPLTAFSITVEDLPDV